MRSSPSEPPNSRNWPKTSFFALFCTIYAHYAYLINYAWPITTATWWERLGLPSYAISSWSEPPKLRKRPMCICAQFMHIVHEPDLCINYNQHHMMRNIQDCHHMQYRVDLSHQSREKGQCAYVHNLCTLCKIRIFPGKNGRVTFFPLLCWTFMPKI